MSWGTALLIAGVVVLLLLPLVALYARRRWLTGQGGLFDCAYRNSDDVAGAGWVLGLARYREDRLQWFRAVSLSLGPAVEFQRGLTSFVGQRPADGVESVGLFEASSVVTLRDRRSRQERSVAMSPESAMALRSWLESAPPGSHYMAGSADSPL